MYREVVYGGGARLGTASSLADRSYSAILHDNGNARAAANEHRKQLNTDGWQNFVQHNTPHRGSVGYVCVWKLTEELSFETHN